MNTLALKGLMDHELSKFTERPIELELFASRLYVTVLEAAYEAQQPKPPEAAEPARPLGAQITCDACGAKRENKGNGKKSRCSAKEDMACYRYAHSRGVWLRANPGRTFGDYATLFPFKREAKVVSEDGLGVCPRCGGRFKPYGRKKYCAASDNRICHLYGDSSRKNEKGLTYEEFKSNFLPDGTFKMRNCNACGKAFKPRMVSNVTCGDKECTKYNIAKIGFVRANELRGKTVTFKSFEEWKK